MCSKYIDAIEFLTCTLPAQPKPVCALNRLSPFYGAIEIVEVIIIIIIFIIF